MAVPMQEPTFLILAALAARPMHGYGVILEVEALSERRVTLRPGRPPVARFIPVYLSDSNGIPAVVTGSAADTILDRLTKLSATFGTTLTRSGDVAWLGAADSSD